MIGGRARVGIMVSLGILAGIGFIGLPSLLFAPAQPVPASTTRTNSTSDYTTGMALSPAPPTESGNTTKTQATPAGDTQVTPGSLAALISLVVAPAVAISLIPSIFVFRRSRKRTNRPSKHE